MATVKLSDLSTKMQRLDICMMTTRSANGKMVSRPMSNNGDVEYDGNSYFFTWEESALVQDLEKDNHVNLAFSGPKQLYISVSGKSKLVKNKATMQEHWLDELKAWFTDGIDTPGIVMIHVEADVIRYWQGEEQGEVKLP